MTARQLHTLVERHNEIGQQYQDDLTYWAVIDSECAFQESNLENIIEDKIDRLLRLNHAGTIIHQRAFFNLMGGTVDSVFVVHEVDATIKIIRDVLIDYELVYGSRMFISNAPQGDWIQVYPRPSTLSG